MNKKLLFLLPLVLTSSLLLAEDKEPPLFKWRKVEIAKIDIGSVSYTHLTLPTILLV